MTCRTVNEEAIKRRQERLAKKAQENPLKDKKVWVNGQAYSSSDDFINDMESQFDHIVRSTSHFKRTS
ncbi:hypothetical protein [Cysteiniphilum sp. 6C5]|uniref:hypothetical protein n=1 Tax=unclassified Cysteiniphilum TaxID=2610889 RepID=UPI003F84C66D